MNTLELYAKLGVASPTAAELQAAWRRVRRSLHPDHGGDAAEFIEADKAFRLALHALTRPKVCTQCGGAGRVTTNHGFASVSLTCKGCRGLGFVKPG